MPDTFEIKAPGLTLRMFSRVDATVVHCTGTLTAANSPLLKSHVKGLLPATKHVVLDLTDLSQMDSSGLGVIVGLYISAKNVGSMLELINLSARVRELFSLTNLLLLFEPCGRSGARFP
jgi:anti-sigma B factor antagonist